jgi:hypothetical protein
LVFIHQLKRFRLLSRIEIKETAAKDGGYFVVEMTSPLGMIRHNYNIWNKTPKAVEIAHGQLSALCRAVGIYQIDWGNEGAALRGGRGTMDVGYQKGEEPSADNPNAKGYTELKRVYDAAGNDPAKPQAAQAQAQPQQGQPMTAQPGGGWGTQAQPQPNPPAPPNGSSAASGWQPGNAGNAPAANPPWGSR